MPSLLSSANNHGFSWILRPSLPPIDAPWEVTLRHAGGAEEAAYGSSWVVLLTHLLGIPLPAAAPAGDPEGTQLPLESSREHEPAPDVVRVPDGGEATPLDEQQRLAAVEMVKALDATARKAFTVHFRSAFSVPSTERSLIPLITELRHLQFIDRFTIEAAGGVAE